MQVTKIQKATPLRIQAYDTLKTAVVSGRMQPGERLTEESAAEFLGVSRTPAREALTLLSREGILDRGHKGGYLVPIPSLRKITKITEVRKLLEPHAARLAAERVTEAELAGLRAAIDAEWGFVEDMTPGTFLAANRIVRNLLYDMSGNEQLVACITGYSDHLQFIGTQTLGSVDVRRVAVNGHDRIYTAVAARDPGSAAEATLHQIEAAQAAAERVLDGGEV